MKALIVTGEASGDLYGGRLATALRSRIPQIDIAGMGGSHMRSAGVEILYDCEKVAVVGVFEVFGKLRNLRSAYSRIKAWVEQNNPDFAILVDFPDFNFRIARLLKRLGVRTFYFISPQLWAWRKGRIHFLREHIQLMICILPFEKSLYENANVPVVYVGHPLVEIVASELADQPVMVRGQRPRIGLMPGSRDVEVRRHLPLLQKALFEIRRRKEVDAMLIWPPSLSTEAYELAQGIELIRENRYAAMKSCDLILVASGTSTLECAILNTPLLIVYRVAAISWWLGKLLVRVPYYGLVNWIAGRKVVPEFIQHDMTPQKLSNEALRLLEDESRRSEMRLELAQLVESLGPPGAMDRAAEAIVRLVLPSQPV